MAENKTTQPDYRHLSYNEMVDLITNLYKEIDRLTAERKASDDALNRLANNVNISTYSMSQIKETVKITVQDTIVSMRAAKRQARDTKKIKKLSRIR